MREIRCWFSAPKSPLRPVGADTRFDAARAQGNEAQSKHETEPRVVHGQREVADAIHEGQQKNLTTYIFRLFRDASARNAPRTGRI